MAYIADTDLRSGTLYPYISVPSTGSGAVSTGRLQAMIGAAQTVVDTYTHDHFEPTTGTLRVQASAESNFLYLPKRVRAVATVSNYDYADVLTSVTSDYFEIESSLDIAGTNLIGATGRDGLLLRKWLPVGTGRWPAYPSYVDVTGSFDWAAVPEEVKLATALLVWRNCNAEIPPGVTRVESATQIYSIGQPGPDSTGLPEVDGMLQQFRRTQVGQGFIGL